MHFLTPSLGISKSNIIVYKFDSEDFIMDISITVVDLKAYLLILYRVVHLFVAFLPEVHFPPGI